MKAIKLGTSAMNDCHIVELPQIIPSYEWYEKEIGCDCIEIVRPRDYPDWALVVDGEALLRDNQELNVLASVMYGTPEHGSPILGKALLMKVKYSNYSYDLVGLTDKDVEEAFKMLDKVFIKAQGWAMKVRREQREANDK